MPRRKKKKDSTPVDIPKCGRIKADGKPCAQCCMRLPEGGFSDGCYQHIKKLNEKLDLPTGTKMELWDNNTALESLADCDKALADLANRVASGKMPAKLADSTAQIIKIQTQVKKLMADLSPTTQATLSFVKERACIAAQKMDLETARRIMADKNAMLDELMKAALPAAITVEEIKSEDKESGDGDNKES